MQEEPTLEERWQSALKQGTAAEVERMILQWRAEVPQLSSGAYSGSFWNQALKDAVWHNHDNPEVVTGRPRAGARWRRCEQGI